MQINVNRTPGQDVYRGKTALKREGEKSLSDQLFFRGQYEREMLSLRTYSSINPFHMSVPIIAASLWDG